MPACPTHARTADASAPMDSAPILMSCKVTVYHPVGLVMGTHCRGWAWCAVSYLRDCGGVEGWVSQTKEGGWLHTSRMTSAGNESRQSVKEGERRQKGKGWLCLLLSVSQGAAPTNLWKRWCVCCWLMLIVRTRPCAWSRRPP